MDLIKKRLKTSKMHEDLHNHFENEIKSLKNNVNTKMNDLVDQIRDLNQSFKHTENHGDDLKSMKTRMEELTASVDEINNRLREFDTMDLLNKDVVTLKNSVRKYGSVQHTINELEQKNEENKLKIEQMLSLLESLTE